MSAGPNGRRQREAHTGRAGKPTGPCRGPGPSLTRQAAALASASLATQASALVLLTATRAAERMHAVLEDELGLSFSGRQ